MMGDRSLAYLELLANLKDSTPKYKLTQPGSFTESEKIKKKIAVLISQA